jgi:hypothetical protein
MRSAQEKERNAKLKRARSKLERRQTTSPTHKPSEKPKRTTRSADRLLTNPFGKPIQALGRIKLLADLDLPSLLKQPTPSLERTMMQSRKQILTTNSFWSPVLREKVLSRSTA